MAFLAFAAPALVGAASIAVSVWLALPAALPGRPATVLLFPGHQQKVLAALTALDPEMRLLGIRASGLLLAIEYKRSDLPARISGSGVIAVIGAGNFGCQY
jgi:hypothetical protein